MLNKMCLILLILVLSGCTSVTKEQKYTPATYYTQTISERELIVFEDYSTFTLRLVEPKKMENGDVLPPQRQANALVKKWLLNKLQGKGLSLAGVGATQKEGVLTVSYALISNAELSDLEMATTYGISPGLITANNENKITLGVAFSAAEKVLWKGAIQGIAQHDLSESMRVQRLQKALQSLVEPLR